ncbi:hypothetical protein VTJ49DRAFT_7010 [Mycothermus thermophilus]|uniref:Uncharacterized protein n=1 Tax=Humicola insolens TaxID=85995 RepID=A0ABR3V0Q4_HUMIN
MSWSMGAPSSEVPCMGTSSSGEPSMVPDTATATGAGAGAGEEGGRAANKSPSRAADMSRTKLSKTARSSTPVPVISWSRSSTGASSTPVDVPQTTSSPTSMGASPSKGAPGAAATEPSTSIMSRSSEEASGRDEVDGVKMASACAFTTRAGSSAMIASSAISAVSVRCEAASGSWAGCWRSAVLALSGAAPFCSSSVLGWVPSADEAASTGIDSPGSAKRTVFFTLGPPTLGSATVAVVGCWRSPLPLAFLSSGVSGAARSCSSAGRDWMSRGDGVAASPDAIPSERVGLSGALGSAGVITVVAEVSPGDGTTGADAEEMTFTGSSCEVGSSVAAFTGSSEEVGSSADRQATSSASGAGSATEAASASLSSRRSDSASRLSSACAVSRSARRAATAARAAL